MKDSRAVLFLAVVAAAVIVSIGFAWLDDEEEVQLSQVPPAARATIQKYAAGGEIKEIEKQTKDGKTLYEVEVVKGGMEYELRVGADGAFLGMEQEGKAETEEEGEGEKKIALGQAPPAVQATIQRVVGGNPLKEVIQETGDGVTVYEAVYLVNGVEHAVECADSGAIIELEKTVTANALPPAVRNALNKRFPGAAIKGAEHVQLFYYEVDLVKNGKPVEVKILPSGKMEGGDEEKGEEEEHEEKDDD